jgi:hypothetical protein
MLVISSKMLRREGAIAVTLEGEGLRWTSVERERGVRPWTSGWRRRQ